MSNTRKMRFAIRGLLSFLLSTTRETVSSSSIHHICFSRLKFWCIIKFVHIASLGTIGHAAIHSDSLFTETKAASTNTLRLANTECLNQPDMSCIRNASLCKALAALDELLKFSWMNHFQPGSTRFQIPRFAAFAEIQHYYIAP